MSDLIRRKDLCDYISAAYYDDRFNDPVVLLDELFERAKHFPAVDAVEVVRCKDCKYAMLLRKPEGKLIADCLIRKMNSEDEQFCMVSGDDFCSYGERREKNEHDIINGR